MSEENVQRRLPVSIIQLSCKYGLCSRVLWYMDCSELRFKALVRAYSAELYRYGYWISGDRAEAEDLVQETFARAWRALASLRDEDAARCWLYTILRREYVRRFKRIQPQFNALDDSPIAAPIEFDTSTEAFALRRALASISAEYREPLVLQILGGFSCGEIGEMLGISANTVMTRVFRARRKLRDVLTGDQDSQVRTSRK